MVFGKLSGTNVTEGQVRGTLLGGNSQVRALPSETSVQGRGGRAAKANVAAGYFSCDYPYSEFSLRWRKQDFHVVFRGGGRLIKMLRG